MNVNLDRPLESLLAAAKELSDGIPEDLLKKVYENQVIHQYDKERERDASLKKMAEVVEDYLKSLSNKDGAK